jgi:hypothetical protein
MTPKHASASRPSFYEFAPFRYNLAMTEQLRQQLHFWTRLVVVLLALVAIAWPVGARAQNPFSDFFGGLFGGGSRHIIQRQAPNYRQPRQSLPERRVPYSEPRTPHLSHSQRSQHRSTAQETPHHPEKVPGEVNFFVAVTGDTLGQILADGLEESFEDTPQVGVLHKGKESSGLVRNDFYDWTKAAREIAAGSQKVDVAIVMIGSNDRQSINEGGQTLDPLSPRWREVYAARVDGFVQSFKDKNIPLVWVGLPVMKAEKFSADMAQINEIYRARAAAANIPFVDLWDKFADDHGQYSAFGPDINGQNVKLRSEDGVHFTGAGGRKLALFVEGEIKRLYDARLQPATPEPKSGADGAPPPAGAATTPAPPSSPAAPVVFRSPEGEPPPVAPSLPEDRPAIGQPQPLTGGSSLASDELARRDKHASQPAAGSVERAVAQHIFIEGGIQPARRGRADDFSWPENKQIAPGNN